MRAERTYAAGEVLLRSGGRPIGGNDEGDAWVWARTCCPRGHTGGALDPHRCHRQGDEEDEQGRDQR